ncbi:MAG: nitrate reductase cytochrome c-type subunit [Thermoanaerobaculia bacterium]
MQRVLVLTVVASILALVSPLSADESGKGKPPATVPGEVATSSTPATIDDSELSLYPGSLFAVPDPPLITWNTTAPGDTEDLPRPYPIAPPRIPHAIADFLPLTLRANGCLDCHALDAGADAPELPASHRTDLRNSPAQVGATVAGARFLCLACHVPTSDAAPIRASRLPAT